MSPLSCRRLLVAAGLLVAAILPASADAPRSGVPAVNGVGARVFAHEVLKAPNATVAVSPLNAGRAMVTLAQGASGTTRTEFAKAFGVKGKSSLSLLARRMKGLQAELAARRDVTVSVAGSLWLDRRAKPAPLLRKGARGLQGIAFFRTDLADPAATGRINKWVEDKTRGMIPTIVDDLPADTSLVIADALYFKGRWSVPFDATLTKPADFRLGQGAPVSVPMMQRRDRMAYAVDDTAQVISFPFAGDRFEARLILPTAGAPLPTQASALVAWLDGQRKRELEPQLGIVRLPRIDISWGGDLMQSLAAAGLERAMSGRARYAGFTRTPLSVGAVSHKVVFRADEAGAEGAAATAVVMTRLMADDPFEMVVDRPFWLVVQDKASGAVLFEARVTDPGTRWKS